MTNELPYGSNDNAARIDEFDANVSPRQLPAIDVDRRIRGRNGVIMLRLRVKPVLMSPEVN